MIEPNGRVRRGGVYPRKTRAFGADSAYIGCFVETGTYFGDSARFATTVFPRVVTIEIKAEFQQQAMARSQGLKIEFLLGDSASLLTTRALSRASSRAVQLRGLAGTARRPEQGLLPISLLLRGDIRRHHLRARGDVARSRQLLQGDPAQDLRPPARRARRDTIPILMF